MISEVSCVFLHIGIDHLLPASTRRESEFEPLL